MLNRKEIMQHAYNECMAEMYAKAQPSADYYQLLEDAKNGKIGKDERIYERYYLSQEEFNHIREKYIEAYGMKESWKSNIETVEYYFINGGLKDKYVKSHTDKNGNYHPGYRGYDTVPSIKKQIQNILEEQLEIGNRTDTLCENITNTVMNTIKECKEYYRFDREESDFSCSIALGPSPTSNPKTVIEYWKSQGIDIEIEERNPLLLWEQDYYGDNFEEVMIDEYGEDWKEIFDKKWEDEKRKKEAKKAELQRQIDEMIKNK